MEAVLPPQSRQGTESHQHSSAELDLPAEVLEVEGLRLVVVFGRTTATCCRRKALVGAETVAALVAVLVVRLPHVRLCCCHVPP